MTLVLGLTGGIASGKSTVSNMIREKGYEIIDADLEARLAVGKGQRAYKKIITHFGEEILLENGELDRAKLGEIVFNSEQERMKLNNIVHPEVRRRMLEKKDGAIMRNEELVVLDIPLLFESELTGMVEKILLVYVDEHTQLDRLMSRNGLTKEQAMARIESQMPLAQKIKYSDAVIDNNGSLYETQAQLNKILQQWL